MKLAALPESIKAFTVMLLILTCMVALPSLSLQLREVSGIIVSEAEVDFFDKHTRAKWPVLLQFLQISSLAGRGFSRDTGFHSNSILSKGCFANGGQSVVVF